METTVILISRQRVVQSSNILLIKTRKPTESWVLIRLSRSQVLEFSVHRAAAEPPPPPPPPPSIYLH